MQAAGILMEKGINFSKIVDETYYQTTFPPESDTWKSITLRVLHFWTEKRLYQL